MTRDAQRLPDYLDHIIQAIDRILRYTSNLTEDDFLHSDIVQDAVIRNFEIIGEASRNIERRYAGFAAAHPEIPFSFAYEMRNVLAHGYFAVDLEIVWKTIKANLRPLRDLIAQAQNDIILGDAGTQSL